MFKIFATFVAVKPYNVRRSIASWVLLSVFVPMTVCLSLHVHTIELGAAQSCYECAHHAHHSGHLATAQGCFHACLLCQLCQVPFLRASATLAPRSPHFHGSRCPLSAIAVVGRVVGVLSSRAPPLV